MTKKEAKKLRTAALDLLNQAAILLKDIQEVPEDEWDDYKQDYVPNPESYPENEFLVKLKHICTDLAKNKENGEVMEYYSSYCF